jgi:hypothetical protein
VAVGFEVVTKARRDVRFVFDDEEFRHTYTKPRPPGADGSSSVNVAPRPTPSL